MGASPTFSASNMDPVPPMRTDVVFGEISNLSHSLTVSRSELSFTVMTKRFIPCFFHPPLHQVTQIVYGKVVRHPVALYYESKRLEWRSLFRVSSSKLQLGKLRTLEMCDSEHNVIMNMYVCRFGINTGPRKMQHCNSQLEWHFTRGFGKIWIHNWHNYFHRKPKREVKLYQCPCFTNACDSHWKYCISNWLSTFPLCCLIRHTIEYNCNRCW